MSINKDKLAKRQEIKGHNPDFVRPESWRYVRLQTNWRKPKSISSNFEGKSVSIFRIPNHY